MLSRRVAALERWAGALLVARDTHRVALAEAGEALARRATDALRSLVQGRDGARDADTDRRHAALLGSTHTPASVFLPP